METSKPWDIAKEAVTQITAWLETTQGGAYEFTDEQKHQMTTQLHPYIRNHGYAEYQRAQQEVTNEILIKLIRNLGPKQVDSIVSCLSMEIHTDNSINH